MVRSLSAWNFIAAHLPENRNTCVPHSLIRLLQTHTPCPHFALNFRWILHIFCQAWAKFRAHTVIPKAPFLARGIFRQPLALCLFAGFFVLSDTASIIGGNTTVCGDRNLVIYTLLQNRDSSLLQSHCPSARRQRWRNIQDISRLRMKFTKHCHTDNFCE